MERCIQGRRFLLYIDESDQVSWLQSCKSKNHGKNEYDEIYKYCNILTVSYKGEYYRLFAFMKQVIEDNNFNFNKRMQELYPEKSA